MGRPSIYTDELAARICERRSAGESVRRICRDDDMPSTTTVMRWLGDNPEFRVQYARACEIDAETEFDALQDIADEATPQDVQVAKLRIDTRKWVLSKRNPKKYGERQEIEHSGETGFIRIIMPNGD